jgi:hypothetical protein
MWFSGAVDCVSIFSHHHVAIGPAQTMRLEGQKKSAQIGFWSERWRGLCRNIARSACSAPYNLMKE